MWVIEEGKKAIFGAKFCIKKNSKSTNLCGAVSIWYQ